jgi:hypothetical protein
MSIRWVSGRCVVVGMVKAWSRVRTGRTSGGAGNWEAGRLGGWGAASGRVRVRVPARAQEGLAWLDLETGQKRGGQVKRATAETSPISLWVVLLTSRRRTKCHPDKGELHEDTPCCAKRRDWLSYGFLLWTTYARHCSGSLLLHFGGRDPRTRGGGWFR